MSGKAASSVALSLGRTAAFCVDKMAPGDHVDAGPTRSPEDPGPTSALVCSGSDPTSALVCPGPERALAEVWMLVLGSGLVQAAAATGSQYKPVRFGQSNRFVQTGYLLSPHVSDFGAFCGYFFFFF